MKQIFHIVLVLSAFLFCACGEDLPPAATTGNITFVITEEHTPQTLEGVDVQLVSQDDPSFSTSDRTDNVGRCTFANMPIGAYVMSLSRPGYESKSGIVLRINGGDNPNRAVSLSRVLRLLTVDPQVLDFEGETGGSLLSFKMINNNYESLKYDVVYNCNWISSVDPLSGTLAYGKTVTAVVKIDREALQAGNNQTKIVVVTEDGSAELTVKAYREADYSPSVEMQKAIAINSSSATLYAKILRVGNPAYIRCGFVYGMNPQPTLDDSMEITATVAAGEIEYSAVVTGLEIGKEYYARAFAVSELGTVYGANQVKIVPAGQLPKLSLGAFQTNSATQSITLKGFVDAVGDPAFTEKGFVYSKELTNPTISDNKIVVEGLDKGVYEAILKNVEFNKTYNVRAYAKNEIGVAYSSSKAVAITTVTPQVQTLQAQIVDRENGVITVNGKVTVVGVPSYTEVGFVYSKDTTTPTVYNSAIKVTPDATGSFTYTISGLNSSYVYYVRAYIKNAVGFFYGQIMEVFTPDFIEIDACDLIMPKADAGVVDWQSAKQLCASSTYLGYTGWRLPTLSELSLILNSGYLRDGKARWTSTTYNSDCHYTAKYGVYGGLYTDAYENTYSFTVRCVRSR